MRYEIQVLKALLWLLAYPFRWLWRWVKDEGRGLKDEGRGLKDGWVLPRRWRRLLIVWTIAALLLLSLIPQLGIAVLEWQADQCSVFEDGQQVVLRGKDCEQY